MNWDSQLHSLWKQDVFEALLEGSSLRVGVCTTSGRFEIQGFTNAGVRRNLAAYKRIDAQTRLSNRGVRT
ncbi:hypothetical protein MIC448_50004 [Microbacterium sp. C448]|nr:hypothetical protein MIC448_50004 [Microbacterium sp. C448]